jgi:hypothetical protein
MCFGRIDFLHVGNDEDTSEKDLDYGNFRPIRTVMPVDKISELFLPLAKQPTNPDFIKIRDDINIQSQLSMIPGSFPYIASSQRFSQIEPNWPSVLYMCYAGDVWGRTPQSPLVKRDLPMYPDGNEAITQFCSLSLGFGEVPTSRLMFIMPDYRGRVKTLRIADGKLSVDVESLEEGVEDLRTKFYYESSAGRRSSGDLPLVNGKAEFEYEGDLEVAMVYLLSSKTGDHIDNRLFNRLGIERRGGVSFAHFAISPESLRS